MPEDVRYEDQRGESMGPGSGGISPDVGGSHGAASDGTSGYRGAAEANSEDGVSGNLDKTSYSATSEGSGSTSDPTLYRDPSVDPAAKIERGESVAPDGGSVTEPIHGETDSPGRIDPAQKMTDTKGVAPIPTVDPTVGMGSPIDPTGSNRML